MISNQLFNEMEREKQSASVIQKLLKENQEYLKDLAISKRELRYLNDTISLMQNEINRLHQVKEPDGVLSKLKKLVGISTK